MRDENFKPGDVAMVTEEKRGDGVVAIRTTSGEWRSAFGESGRRHIVEERRLVVIDPEDREQVERLTDCLWATNDEATASNNLQAALREFANPTPPIEEPTNLYAVVRDRSDHEWAHIGGQVWRSLSSPGPFMVEKHWHDTDAPLAGNVAAILAEGVTP